MDNPLFKQVVGYLEDPDGDSETRAILLDLLSGARIPAYEHVVYEIIERFFHSTDPVLIYSAVACAYTLRRNIKLRDKAEKLFDQFKMGNPKYEHIDRAIKAFERENHCEN